MGESSQRNHLHEEQRNKGAVTVRRHRLNTPPDSAGGTGHSPGTGHSAELAGVAGVEVLRLEC